MNSRGSLLRASPTDAVCATAATVSHDSLENANTTLKTPPSDGWIWESGRSCRSKRRRMHAIDAAGLILLLRWRAGIGQADRCRRRQPASYADEDPVLNDIGEVHAACFEGRSRSPYAIQTGDGSEIWFLILDDLVMSTVERRLNGTAQHDFLRFPSTRRDPQGSGGQHLVAFPCASQPP